MAASWLLQAIYTSLLSSVGDPSGGMTGSSSPSTGPVSGQQLANTVLANTTAGVVRGSVDNSSHPTIFRYLGVPYAKPPLGDLRFEAPVDCDPWRGVRDALTESSQCWQPLWYPSSTPPSNSEDCLYLNIYTPARDTAVGLLPVMIWIHGGSYAIGAGARYNGTRLAREGGVVIVTINYRLDVFGFLSTEDSDMPGNYGLLDMIQALKWTHENIAQFGGDPNSVTIFGESSGSTSVSLLNLSPLAKGLFHRSIMQSGVSLTPWAYLHPAQRLLPIYGARLLGKAHGCDHFPGQSKQYMDCLRKIDAADLIKSASDISNVVQTIWLLPRVDTASGFLPDHPVKLLARGQYNQVDTIRGYNSHEQGAVKIRDYSQRVDTKELFAEALRNSLEPYAIPSLEDLLERFENLYIGNSTDPDFIWQQASAASADFSFAGPTLKELQAVAAQPINKNHYLYRYDYRDSFSKNPSWVGAVHMDEVKYIFGLDQLNPGIFTTKGKVISQEDKAMSQQMMSLWVNFAKTGNPTASESPRLQWEPFTSERPRMLKINSVSAVGDFSRSKVVDLYGEILQIFDAYSPDTENIIG
ncbi:carboxylic ester hydrolase [Elysia marginata]|uniref:Carboxylic ester hydrolase n=1 Tax=Elysia marginata TaxID=1093978 RepID=A0AAV4HPM3_9GAST|nr:carboxylic ester hydrolase [Elysia marginata]